MVSVQDRQRFSVIEADKDNGSKSVIVFQELIANRRNLAYELGVDQVFAGPKALHNLIDREVPARELPPLGPRENPHLFEVRLAHLHLVPAGSCGKLFPEGQMPNEQQSSPYCIVTCMFQVGIGENPLKRLLVVPKFRSTNLTFQKLGNHLIL